MNTSTPSLARHALAWLPALAWAGLIFFLSAQPRAAFPDLALMELLSSGAHFTAYGVLMALLVRALRSTGRLPAERAWLFAFALAALYGLSDEYHQSFVPGRTPTLIDWLTDMAGALTAWIILLRRERRSEGNLAPPDGVA